MKTGITTAIVLAAGLAMSCSETSKDVDNAQDVREMASGDTAVMYDDLGKEGELEADGAEVNVLGEDFWAAVDFDAPVVADPKLKDSGIEKRSADKGYTVYSMDERVLFDLDKAALRAGADEKLSAIAESIKEISDSGPIRVFGHTDAIAGKAYNEKLSAERANNVKDWLQSKGGIDASRLSIEAMGETAPIATNETARGRQLNRRVVVVVATN
ncbi:OmpA family protein [Pontibacter sp. E15-1]|uniref:OmpA family protein n=1 Tax=Pontibacter sp. E15-1 TaxID=2919918 RepID=UPI001F500CD7|nr:OmpA family protein [Pontibacter sp. E15-1]MCJ8163860.1 OmpA family protein [Pontibacter sp. E15-1]